jgi:hypothetical protein
MLKAQTPLPDPHQNFWVLASIQSASMGLLGMIIGGQIAQNFGAANAVKSICVANLILWAFRIIIISMAATEKKDAIENVKRYLGTSSAFFASIFLIGLVLVWYVMQIKASTDIVNNIFSFPTASEKGTMIRFGAAFGLFAALFSIGGIRFIKWIHLFALPILFFYCLHALFTQNLIPISWRQGEISFAAVSACILFQIPETVNLPTFFRHSQSTAHSILALTIMFFFISFFQISSIYLDFSDATFFHMTNGSIFSLNSLFILFFIAIILLCNLTTNIYLASAGFESIMQRRSTGKEYAIIGLLGTAAFTFIQISPPMIFLKNLGNYFISNLAVALSIAYVGQYFLRQRLNFLKKFGKLIGSAAWTVGCVSSIILEIQNPNQTTQTLLSSAGISAFFFLTVIFIGDTFWAAKKLIASKTY